MGRGVEGALGILLFRKRQLPNDQSHSLPFAFVNFAFSLEHPLHSCQNLFWEFQEINRGSLDL